MIWVAGKRQYGSHGFRSVVVGSGSLRLAMTVPTNPIVRRNAVQGNSLGNIRFQNVSYQLREGWGKNVLNSTTEIPFPSELVLEQFLQVGVIKGHRSIDHDVEDDPQ